MTVPLLELKGQKHEATKVVARWWWLRLDKTKANVKVERGQDDKEGGSQDHSISAYQASSSVQRELNILLQT